MMSAMVCWEFEYYFITSLMLILASSSSVVSLGALPHNHSLSHVGPLCREDESSALLHFKQSFVIECSNSKINSWVKSRDCCSWEGIECDEETGHVIGLDLFESCLYGNFPSNSSLFSLTHLQQLNLARNNFTSSPIPSGLDRLTKLVSLDLSTSEFSGEIPSQLSKLSKLSFLDLSENNELKLKDVSLEKLVQNFTRLTHLALDHVIISSPVSITLTNFTSLKYLSLRSCNLGGSIPSSLGELKKLGILGLAYNHFNGSIPSSLANLTQLRVLSLSYNHLTGPVPEEITQLINLEKLYLAGNDGLYGNFDPFLKLTLLKTLWLHEVTLTFSTQKVATNGSHTQLNYLSLHSTNLEEFPQFLHGQHELQWLDLSHNKIRGLVPQWLVNITKGTLYVQLSLSHNFLTGFEHSMRILPWNRLQVLDLRSNQFQGSLPIPPTSMKIYQASNNQLVGSIPQQICQASSLIHFDVSDNNLGGQIPDCISKLGNSLMILHLRGNNFNGTIPRSYPKSCALKMINLSQNQLEGTLPRSLVNCNMLMVLDIGQNCVNDTFPSWLGSLPNLHVLVLRHNNFHGRIIGKSKVSGDFPSLRIVDLSHNFHTGDLPSDYLQNWDAMKIVEASQPSTSVATISFIVSMPTGQVNWNFTYNLSIIIANKGSERLYPKIWTFLRVIDFSSNSFTGKIPDSIGELRGLEALNLSNNNLEGGIPSSLSNISALESLDLSTNNLSGRIPQELAQLTFLEVLNVSHNRLTGPIPQGTQFDTFNNSSFDGNPGLCGIQVPKKCGNVHHESSPSPSVVSGNDEEEDSDVIDWIIRALGCVGGFVVGYVIGNYFTDRHHDWFVETFGKKRRSRKTRQGAPRRRT